MFMLQNATIFFVVYGLVFVCDGKHDLLSRVYFFSLLMFVPTVYQKHGSDLEKKHEILQEKRNYCDCMLCKTSLEGI